MSRSTHEDSAVAALMGAPLADQAATMADWGMMAAGLLIMMSPCQGRCFFCAQPAVTHPPPKDWTQWERIEALLSGNRDVGLKRLCIGGTEPTTHPDFQRALTLARDTGFEQIELMTSALALATPGTAQRWADAGIHTIATPIYSASAQAHDAVVGTPTHARLVAGLDAARAAGIVVKTHTLALRRTLPELGPLAQMCMERWQSTLCLAPARPKDAVWSFDTEAPSLTEVASALETVPPGMLTLTGWPSCLQSGQSRDAAQVIALYFRGQQRSYDALCDTCTEQATCPGVVSALLRRDGPQGLRPR